MKRAPRSRQRHDLYAKYHDYDSEISDLLGECGFYMLSGDCMPIKTAEYIRGRLEREDVDYIESFDFFGSDWIKTGIKEERLIYRHWFNERKRKWLFYRSMELQQRFGLARQVPEDLAIRIGSQW